MIDNKLLINIAVSVLVGGIVLYYFSKREIIFFMSVHIL